MRYEQGAQPFSRFVVSIEPFRCCGWQAHEPTSNITETAVSVAVADMIQVSTLREQVLESGLAYSLLQVVVRPCVSFGERFLTRHETAMFSGVDSYGLAH